MTKQTIIFDNLEEFMNACYLLAVKGCTFEAEQRGNDFKIYFTGGF